jgi:uncharacterized membrane protein
MPSRDSNDHGATRSKTSGVLSLAVGGVLVLYPVLMYVGHAHLAARSMAVILVALCAARLVALRFAPAAQPARTFGTGEMLAICVGAIALALLTIWRGSPQAMLYYPVLVNAVFLAVFAWSLFHPPTVVERIARATTPDVPPEAAPYLRRVTIAWSIFFVCNGAAALFTAMETSFATWTFYNGFLAYVLIALMFGAEFLARQRAMKNLLK